MKSLIKYVLIISFALSVHVSCDKGKNENEIVKIGSILPLTGPASVYGSQVKSGQEKALKHFLDSTQSSVNIELVFEDGKGDPKESVNAYNKLRSQGVKIFTTTTSAVSLALLPKAVQDSVLIFADAAHPKITSPYNQLVFRHSNTTDQESNMISDFIKNRSFERIALICLNDDYGVATINSISDQLKLSSGCKLVFNEGYDRSEINFNTLVTKLNKANPDITVIVSFGPTMGNLIKKIKEFNIKTEIIASIGFIITGSNNISREYANGINYVNFLFQSSNDNEEVVSINPFETLGYGTTLLLCKAIEVNGNNPFKIANYLKSINRFDSGFESMTILPSNDILPELTIKTYKH